MGSPKKQLLYDEILTRLSTGRYQFGERILVNQLAQETGASRQPIMAALNALSADGFLEIIPQVGCKVVTPGIDDIADFYKMFGRLEALLAELAATRRSDAQVSQLQEINMKIRQLPQKDRLSAVKYRPLNQAFHKLVHQMASSPLLDARQATLYAMSDFFIMQTIGFGPHMVAAGEEHEAIVSAIDRRRSDAARRAAEKHIEAVAESVLSGMGAQRGGSLVARSR